MTADTIGIILNKTLIPMSPSRLILAMLKSEFRGCIYNMVRCNFSQVRGISASQYNTLWPWSLFLLLQFLNNWAKLQTCPLFWWQVTNRNRPVSLFLVYSRWQCLSTEIRPRGNIWWISMPETRIIALRWPDGVIRNGRRDFEKNRETMLIM